MNVRGLLRGGLLLVSLSVGIAPRAATVAAHPRAPAMRAVTARAASHRAHARVGAPGANACKVKSMTMVGTGGYGHAWSPIQNTTLVYAAKDRNGFYQIYRTRLSPGATSLGVAACLTCVQRPGGPAVKLNKGSPTFDPTGRYLVMNVEMAHHPGPHQLAVAGTGWFQDLWALDTKTNKWWNLTHYPETGTHGALIPRISFSGKKIAWAELYRAPSRSLEIRHLLGLATTGPIFGYWRLAIGDFVAGPRGVQVKNVRTYRPGNADFYETQSWSPDDKRLAFASDIGLSGPLTLNIWFMDVATGKVTAFTHDKGRWSEHLTFANAGSRVAFMSSRCCRYVPTTNYGVSLSTELYLANADGSHVVQLTHFNEPGYPESQRGGGIVNKPEFSRDGTMLLFHEVPHSSTGGAADKIRFEAWLITFAGPCGGVRTSRRP